jgi:Predicted integral membrane protein (DUF2269)
MTLYLFVLFLHVLGAILAFGTAMLAFPVIGALGEREPAHHNFALRVSYVLGRYAVTPLALATFVLGLGLVALGGWDLFANEWLWVSIALFLVTVLDAQLITLPSVGQLVTLTGPSATPTMDQSHDIERLTRKVRFGGTLSAILLVVITLLMVWKPGS